MSKTVFLTGGSSGIGNAISEKLISDDWSVIAPKHHELDLSNLERVTAFAFSNDFLAEDINALIHVAGIWHDEETALADKDFRSFTPQQIIETMNVGVTSFMILANQLIAHGKPSRIIGISGTFESGGRGWLPYYTSKRALEDFLVGLAQDDPQLKVYGVSPADTATPAYKHFYPQYAESAQSPQDVADLVMSLLKSESEFAGGSVIEIRGAKPQGGFHS
jgi:NAD(P)-dependent dehydrogenase (short-subunit alcohol dehydrogenase family)